MASIYGQARCYTCSKHFTMTRKQAENKRLYGRNKAVVCSVECLHGHRKKRRHSYNTSEYHVPDTCAECGIVFELSARSKHYRKMKPDSKHRCSVCRNKGEVYHAPVTCAGCGVVFKASANIKAYRKRNPGGMHNCCVCIATGKRSTACRQSIASVFCKLDEATCAHCQCLFLLGSNRGLPWRKSKGTKLILCALCLNSVKNGKLKLDLTHLELPPAYWADHVCDACNVTFSLNENQRCGRKKYPGGNHYCSKGCQNEINIARIMKYERISGPAHSGWKHGAFSKVMKQAKKLVWEMKHKLKDATNEYDNYN